MRLKTVGMLIRTLVLFAVTTWEGCRGLAQVTVVRLQTMETASNTTYLDSGENALPDLPQWTLCVRLRLLHLARLNTLLSYTTGTFYQEILLGIEWPQSSLRLECCGYSGFMELKVPIRLFTWHHLCVSANMTGDSQHIVFDNVIHEALIRRPGITPAELNKVRGGGRFLVGQNYNPAAFYVVELLLTSCGENDFTCSDGSCINKTKRCDYKVDCQDSTDELNCQAIVFPEGYPSELAPPAGDSEQMALYISIQITSIRKFDLAGFNLAIDVIQSIKWKDERLLLRNLRPGDFVNKARVIEKLWMPEILVSDGYYNPTDVKQHLVKLLIRRDSQSLPDDDTYYTEDDMYSGSGSTLKLVQQYTVTAMCLFLLHVYPFDSQICSLTFSLPDQSAGNLLLVQEGVAFTGKRMLLEYQLLNETLVSWNNLSTSMQLRLQFRNQYGYYIGNSVIPSLLMVSICYLTFFFAMEDFTDRIMVSLTSLLVLASLFTQTSQSIPKTAYLKLIDIWHVSLIITDFLIVVTLVVIENQRLVDKLQSDFNASSALRNVKGITPVVACRLPARSHGMNNNLLVLHQRRCSAAMKYNRASQVMFPVLACAGTFGWILVHLYRSPSAPEH